MKIKQLREIQRQVQESKDIEEIKSFINSFMDTVINEYSQIEISNNELQNNYKKITEEYKYLFDEKEELHQTIFDIKDYLRNLQPTLTKKQTEILKQLKQGLTFAKIAELNNISSGTVDYHKKKLVSLGLI